MTIFILWFVLSILVGVGASNRGRSGGGWFFLALVISPIIAGFALVMVGRLESAQRPSERVCPFCKGPVDLDATRCRHCQSDISATAMSFSEAASYRKEIESSEWRERAIPLAVIVGVVVLVWFLSMVSGK